MTTDFKVKHLLKVLKNKKKIKSWLSETVELLTI